MLLLVVGAIHDTRQPNGKANFVTAGNAGELLVVGLAVLVGLGYPYLLLRFRGQTVGMMTAGVRAVDRA